MAAIFPTPELFPGLGLNYAQVLYRLCTGELLKHRINGPHHRRPIPFGDVDQRTYEGRLLRDFRDALIEQVGGSPTFAQRALIERTAWINLRCALLDGKIATDSLTEMDTRVYLAWQNALRRNLQALGLGEPGAAETAHTYRLAPPPEAA